jgi:hypothetical protein
LFGQRPLTPNQIARVGYVKFTHPSSLARLVDEGAVKMLRNFCFFQF